MNNLVWFYAAMFGLAGAFVAGGLFGAPWVPARGRDVQGLIDQLELGPSKQFVDLGCGDGRFVRAAAKTGAISVGYEINPLLCLWAKLRLWRQPHAQVHWGNFWQHDLGSADVVAAFIMPKFMARLEAKLLAETRPGTVAILYVYKFPVLKPELYIHNSYIYRINEPADQATTT